MIIPDKDNYFNGNTVLNPSEQPLRKQESKEYEELKKAKNELLKIKKQKKLRLQAKIMINIFVGFSLCMLMEFRYSMIYSMQKNLTDTNNSISKISKQNENLKIQLAKFEDVSVIEEKAVKELHMEQPNKNSAIYMDLDKENFKDGVQASNNNKPKSFFEEIKNFFF